MTDTSDAAKVNLGKGRPTPKRRDAQGRRGPVAPPPTTKREAAKRLREKQERDRKSGRSSAADPGERLLKRDQGPVRARVRDLVDGRRNLVLLVLPVLFMYVIAGLSGNKDFLNFVMPFYLGALLLIVFDLFAIKRLISSRLRVEFPDDTQKGHTRYAIMRAISFRRMRVPKARVSPPPLLRRGRS